MLIGFLKDILMLTGGADSFLKAGVSEKEKSTDIELFDLLLDTWIQALSVDVGLDIFQMIDVFSKSIIWYKDIFHLAPHKGIIA